MQTITEKTVREIAAENPASVAVFERLGIDYCCGGGKPLSEACARAGADIDQVVHLLEDANGETAANDQPNWNQQPLRGLIAHIVDNHHAYVTQETPRMQALLHKVVSKHGEAHPELRAIEPLFEAMGQELSTHMMKEEHVLFPYIEHLEDSAGNAAARPRACFDTVKRPIANMIAEHDDAGALLERIRELSNGYALPAGACPTYQALYRGLEAFERDLHQHVHLENNILFPRAIELEEAL